MSNNKEKKLSNGFSVDDTINQIILSQSPEDKLIYLLKKSNENDIQLILDAISSCYGISANYFAQLVYDKCKRIFGSTLKFTYTYCAEFTVYMFDKYDFKTNCNILNDNSKLNEELAEYKVTTTIDKDKIFNKGYKDTIDLFDNNSLHKLIDMIQDLILKRNNNSVNNLKWIDVKDKSNGQKI
jgi:hypothetical protein